MKKILVVLPLVSFLAFGCNFKNMTRPGLGNTAENSPAPFTLDTLKNADYRFEVKELADAYNKSSLKLTNGIYYFALPQGAVREEYLVKLDEKNTAFGDLDSDGKPDAAVVLTSMAGKNRTFQTLAVLLNKKGSADYVAGTVLGQGVIVESVAVRDGKVEVSEKASSGSELQKNIFRLNGSELVKE